jgi:hypothetical protein
MSFLEKKEYRDYDTEAAKLPYHVVFCTAGTISLLFLYSTLKDAGDSEKNTDE